jgi:hypothetical protein
MCEDRLLIFFHTNCQERDDPFVVHYHVCTQKERVHYPLSGIVTKIGARHEPFIDFVLLHFPRLNSMSISASISSSVKRL